MHRLVSEYGHFPYARVIPDWHHNLSAVDSTTKQILGPCRLRSVNTVVGAHYKMISKYPFSMIDMSKQLEVMK